MASDSGSGSAILPPKKPARVPLKLSLAASSEGLTASTPPLTLGAATTTRPSLKLPALATGASTTRGPATRPSLVPLSLHIATDKEPPSRYRTALNGPADSEDERNGYTNEADSTTDDDDGDDGADDADEARWGQGDQERMTGELLDVIRGPSALEDELSGKTRRMQISSTSTTSLTAKTEQSGSSASSNALTVPSEDEADGDDELDSSTASPVCQRMEVTAATLQDLGRLGEGVSGEVRKVLHRPSGIVMAKKTIATSPNPKLHKQHLRELLFMRECSHPAIVQYYGAFLEENNSQIGICMEFCEAGSLDSLYKKVKAKGWRTGEKVLGKIAESMISGLVYLHDRKIIHRDIKPSNVLVTQSGQIKLCDFGVSGELVNSFAGTFVGTTFYLSPERIRGGKYTITSDVWSMALTVLEVALNRFPFPGPGEAPLHSPIELLTYLIKMDGPRFDDEPENGIKYTNAFRDFIRVCMDKDPTTRPTPQKLSTHGWIVRSATRQPPPDLGRRAMAAKEQQTSDESVMQKVARVIPGLGSSAQSQQPAKKGHRSRKPKASAVSAPVDGTATTADGETKPLASVHESNAAAVATTASVADVAAPATTTATDDDELAVEDKKTSAVEACSKRIRNISKKLRNIATLEEKSETLNADQQRAVASKPTLQAILKELEELLAVLKAEEAEDQSRDQRVQAIEAKKRSRDIDAAVALARKDAQQELVLLFQFLHLHGLYTQQSGFAPPVLPPVVANASGQDVAAVRMLYDAFANGPLLGGHDDAVEKLSKVAAGSEEEVLPSVTYARVKELIAGLTSTPEAAPGPSAQLTPNERPVNESSAVATPADSVVALVDGATDQQAPSFMNASEIQPAQTPTTEEKVTSWAGTVEPAVAPTPIDGTQQSAPAVQTTVRDWSADDQGDELPPLSELSQNTVAAPGEPPVGASAVSPANANENAQPAVATTTGGGRGGRRGRGGDFSNGEGRRGSFRGGRGGPRGGGRGPNQGAGNGDRAEGWREYRGPREEGGEGRGRGRGRGGRGRGGPRGGHGPQTGVAPAAPAPSA
ncbi:Protein kinase C signaling pathway involved MAPKK protein [Microbotryomycetes sp. JL201]|nr:Protein kinase C signaling pathway involved MAPKK protein [Microbotryomycetes sp. JL201]